MGRNRHRREENCDGGEFMKTGQQDTRGGRRKKNKKKTCHHWHDQGLLKVILSHANKGCQ
jgi:hypothetical protein